MINLLWVPLPVLQKALVEKNHREIALFLYLKMTTTGRVKIEGRKKREILQMLSISSPILYRRLKRLRKWNWIGYDEAKRVYYIRGFKYLYEKEGFKSRTTVRIKIHDLFHLQAFAFSASLGYLLRAQSRWKRRGAEQKTRCSQQSPASVFKPVSLSVMESFFSLSQDTLINLKNHSIRLGYLSRERGYKELFSASDYHPGYYDAFPEHWGRLRKIKTTTGLSIVLIESDRFIDHHWYKRKRYK
jgi:hypothetical protein